MPESPQITPELLQNLSFEIIGKLVILGSPLISSGALIFHEGKSTTMVSSSAVRGKIEKTITWMHENPAADAVTGGVLGNIPLIGGILERLWDNTAPSANKQKLFLDTLESFTKMNEESFERVLKRLEDNRESIEDLISLVNQILLGQMKTVDTIEDFRRDVNGKLEVLMARTEPKADLVGCPPDFLHHISDTGLFSICYPRNWTLKEVSNPDLNQAPDGFFQTPTEFYDPSGIYGPTTSIVNISVKTFANNKVPRDLDQILQDAWLYKLKYSSDLKLKNKDYLLRRIGQPIGDYVSGLPSRTINFDFLFQKFYAYPDLTYERILEQYVFDQDNSRVFLAAYECIPPSFDNYKVTFDKMRSTFQILRQKV